MDLLNLTAKLTLDIKDYEYNIKVAKGENTKLEDSTRKMSLANIALWTAISTAVIALGNNIKNLIVDSANYADQIGDLASKWGFATKEIQEFDYWATMNGTTLESLLTGMRGLVNQAEAGANAFKVLGVNVKDNNGNLKDQKTLFLETIDALKRVDNQTERNALQFEIFGRAGIELGQIISRDSEELKQLSQNAEDLGIILSDKTIQSAGDFNDKLDQLRLQGKSAFAELIAGADGASEKFDEYAQNLTDTIQDLAPKFLGIGLKLGWNLIKGIFKGLLDTAIDWQLAIFGKGWLWGKEDNEQELSLSNTESAISTINNVTGVERTETINETLDITLRVESDGTSVSEENLNIVSELVVDKINELLGGEL